MSLSSNYSYVEAFLQKAAPSMGPKELITTKTSLRNKPVMLVAEKKAKIMKKKKSIRSRFRGRIMAKPSNSNYADYETLRTLWKDYITCLLSDYMVTRNGESSPSLDIKNAQEVLIKADFHGADLTVCDSPCKALRGVTGTVLQETKNIFLICSTRNKIVKIPKSKTIFTLEHPPGYRTTLFGSQFCFKPSHRLTKRFNKNPTLKELR